MVSYKIGIYNRKEARIIDLDKITKIKSLDKLDELTSAFNSEEELKIYLFNQELISLDEMKKSLSVMYKNSGKVKKLPIIFNHMKKHLDITYLRAKLMSLSNDIEFLEKLARHYSIGSDKFNPQGVNVSDIRMYISDVRNNGGNQFYSRSLEIALDDMWKKAVFKLVDRSTGEVKENYRGSRDLGMFLYKYEKTLEKKEEKQEIKEDAKKENRIEPQWEQTTLFDLINKQEIVVEEPPKMVLSSEGEPDFPPNSEEERNYLRYLEDLEEMANNEPIENHPHYRR
ncbi:MAG: hypothetical protein IJE04_02595 [Bacilli bacterium]|nr:hypothetical protein [Bacilli bacterium]